LWRCRSHRTRRRKSHLPEACLRGPRAACNTNGNKKHARRSHASAFNSLILVSLDFVFSAESSLASWQKRATTSGRALAFWPGCVCLNALRSTVPVPLESWSDVPDGCVKDAPSSAYVCDAVEVHIACGQEMAFAGRSSGWHGHVYLRVAQTSHET
jgi:hypothetical protein